MIATVVGATGLIGNHCLQLLLADPYFNNVRILLRRPIPLTHEKLEKKIVDFSDGDSLLVALSNSDVVFCAVGTTQKKVKGDQEAYRKVDHDIPVNIARYCKITGCEKFILVSSVGARSSSNNFYLQLKGEVEDVVRNTGLKSVHILRPSILFGDRKEFRMGEKIGSALMSGLSFLLPSRYKPIHAGKVANKMVVVAKEDKEGFFVYEGKALFD